MARYIIGYTIIFLLLCIGAYTDAKQRIIPNWVNLGIFLAGFILPTVPIGERFLNLAVIVIAIILSSVITKKKSGGGDIKLYCALAFALTLAPTAIILVLAILFMLVHRAIAKKEKGAKYPVCCYVAPAYVLWIAGNLALLNV